MSNTLSDLNNHLFDQLNRLGTEGLKGEALEAEIERSRAVSAVAKDIVNNARLQLDAVKVKAEYQGLRPGDLPVGLIGHEGK